MRLAHLALAATLAAGCYNARHTRVALRDNPAGADCFMRCDPRASDAARMACVAACPGATQEKGVCKASDGEACTQTRTFSTWKTGGLVLLGVVAVGVAAQ